MYLKFHVKLGTFLKAFNFQYQIGNLYWILKDVMLVRLAWTGHTALAFFSLAGLDICPASQNPIFCLLCSIYRFYWILNAFIQVRGTRSSIHLFNYCKQSLKQLSTSIHLSTGFSQNLIANAQLFQPFLINYIFFYKLNYFSFSLF